MKDLDVPLTDAERIRLRFREEVAEATERAIRELAALGYELRELDDPDVSDRA